jgi:hypothetical protein
VGGRSFSGGAEGWNGGISSTAGALIAGPAAASPSDAGACSLEESSATNPRDKAKTAIEIFRVTWISLLDSKPSKVRDHPSSFILHP